MCLVCIELQKDRMTTREALRAIGEFVMSPSPDADQEDLDHYKGVMEDLSERVFNENLDAFDIIRLETDGG